MFLILSEIFAQDRHQIEHITLFWSMLSKL